MAELRARHPSSPGEVPQSGQQQGYSGQALPTCEEYVEKNRGNGDLSLGPFGPQVNMDLSVLKHWSHIYIMFGS